MQQHEQPSSGNPVQIALVLATFRQLCQLSGSDAIFLSIYGAASELGLDREEAVKMMKGVIAQSAKAWPKGFM